MSDERRPRVSCVLPAYNEAANLPATVAGWAAALERHTDDYEIIVVDDGSTDDTPAVLRELGARHPRLRVVSHGTNRGYGVAIANGFRHATLPLLFFTDADGQYDPEEISLLLARISDADLVIGYRKRRADPGFRYLLSRGYNLLVRRIVGVSLRDINCAFKLMHRRVFETLGIDARHFMVNAELAVRATAARMTIVEVAVGHQPRRAGRTSVRPHHVVSGIYGLVRLRLRDRRVAWDAARLARGVLGCEASRLPPQRHRGGERSTDAAA
jgi:dolichol-phosphate mannosyltransferase